MHTGITSLLSLLEVKVSFSATYMGSSHTPNLASSDQNLWYNLYLLLVLAKQAPALPLSHEGGFSMIHGVRRQCRQALSPSWFLNDTWCEEAVWASVITS